MVIPKGYPDGRIGNRGRRRPYCGKAPRDQSFTVSRALMIHPASVRVHRSRYCTPIVRSAWSLPGAPRWIAIRVAPDLGLVAVDAGVLVGDVVHRRLVARHADEQLREVLLRRCLTEGAADRRVRREHAAYHRFVV